METVALFGQTRHGLGRLWLRAWAWLGGIAEPAARWGMALAGLPVWIFLCWYSFRYSYLEGVHVPEKLSLVKDSMGRHMLGILALALAWGGLLRLERRCSKARLELGARSLALLAVAWHLAWGLWWIYSSDKVPGGDQAFLYGGASYLLEGSRTFLGLGGYLEMYPHQLPAVFVVQSVFSLVGTYQYPFLQLCNVLFAAGTVGLAYGLLEAWGAGFAAKAAYALLALGLQPLVYYTSFVYGELGFCFFALAALCCFVYLDKKGRPAILSLMGICLWLMWALRPAGRIFLLAFCLCLGLWALRRGRLGVLALALFFFLIPNITLWGLRAYYYPPGSAEYYTGGMPVEGWLALGIEESPMGPGWYNHDVVRNYYLAECDPYEAAKIYRQQIEARLAFFRDYPGEAGQFYKDKILSQWIAPLYQGLFFGSQPDQGKQIPEGSLLAYVYSHGGQLQQWADVWQFLVYGGVLCFFAGLPALGRRSIPLLVLPMALLGTFVFSLFWEAKARYIFPSYVLMYPMAALGLEAAFGLLQSGWRRWFWKGAEGGKAERNRALL